MSMTHIPVHAPADAALPVPENKAPAPLWRIAFRPFFALGALAAVLLMGVWLLALSGHFPLALSPLWHAHEMLYGFGSAILCGFLLTAIQNWSGQRSLHGRRLQLLAGVWLLGRLGAFAPWPLLTALLDLAFFPLFLLFLHPYLALPKQKRNRIFYGLLSLMTLGNLLYHVQMLGWSENTARSGIYLALHLYLAMCMLIGGRIIPAFTRGAVENARISQWPALEKTVFGLSALWLASEALLPAWAGVFALLAGLAHLVRWLGWRPWQTWRKPILWVLPLGYAWLITGLLLRAGLGYSSTITHLFTVGVVGGLMHAMLTRVSLGHTGRTILTTGLGLSGYLLLQLAIVLRAFGPTLSPALYLQLMLAAGLAWMLVFGLYLFEYLPLLVRPRPDGRTDS
ncbi:MAG: NnrS family protein [Candidatus Sericytochromatia bacterium]|nr:NnrS family protein [Candidatus Sericytochromatia bacterium]